MRVGVGVSLRLRRRAGLVALLLGAVILACALLTLLARLARLALRSRWVWVRMRVRVGVVGTTVERVHFVPAYGDTASLGDTGRGECEECGHQGAEEDETHGAGHGVCEKMG